MGTSQAARLPITRKTRKIPASLRNPERNAETVVNAVVSAALPALSGGIASEPAFYAITEGIQFALDARKHGIAQAAERSAIRISEKYVAPSIAKGLWDIVESRMDAQLSGSPYGRLAESAFRKTVSSIVTKGAEAISEASEND